MNGYVAIPESLFLDPAYRRLGAGDRLQLIYFYYLFGAVPHFHLDPDCPLEYGVESREKLIGRLRALSVSGLLVDINPNTNKHSATKNKRYAFKYPAAAAYEEVA